MQSGRQGAWSPAHAATSARNGSHVRCTRRRKPRPVAGCRQAVCGAQASPTAHSVHFTLVRSLAWIGAFSHRPLQLGVPHADLRQLEQEAVDRVVGQDLLRLPVELRALGLVGGAVQLGDDLVEGRIVVVEVVVLARIDIDVDRLGVRDDGQVVVLVGEHLLQPLRPFDRDDLELDADLAQLRGDDLAAAPRIGRRRQLQRRLEAASRGRPPSAAPWPWRDHADRAGQVDIGRVVRGEVRADRRAEAGRWRRR